MIFTLRRYLLVLLGVLQLAAPLVHAHSGNNFVKCGLHLPNLEVYATAENPVTPFFQAVDYWADLNDVIISISTGIENQHDMTDDAPPLCYFPPEPVIFSPILQSCEINFSPQRVELPQTVVYSPQAPRAPPVLF